jgi:hypothetical protein
VPSDYIAEVEHVLLA